MSENTKGSFGARLLIVLYGAALVALGVQPVKKDAQETAKKVRTWVEEHFAMKPPSIKAPSEKQGAARGDRGDQV